MTVSFSLSPIFEIFSAIARLFSTHHGYQSVKHTGKALGYGPTKTCREISVKLRSWMRSGWLRYIYTLHTY